MTIAGTITPGTVSSVYVYVRDVHNRVRSLGRATVDARGRITRRSALSRGTYRLWASSPATSAYAICQSAIMYIRRA